MTGNGVIFAVDEIITLKSKLRPSDIQSAMEMFIESQVLIPGEFKPLAAEELQSDSQKARLLRAMQNGLETCKETI